MSPRRGAASKKTRRIVVTAGPTRERIDPVRYLSNDSSGRMGFAIAEAAREQGDEVILIAGPVELDTPPGVRRVDVESAREMLAAAREAFDASDALFMAAAVCDWRPARRLAGKWRAKDGDAKRTSLDLVANPDILATLCRGKGERLAVGFALETSQGLKRARAKLERKGADYIVLNAPAVLGQDRTTVTILGADGTTRRLEDRSKLAVARVLVTI